MAESTDGAAYDLAMLRVAMNVFLPKLRESFREDASALNSATYHVSETFPMDKFPEMNKAFSIALSESCALKSRTSGLLERAADALELIYNHYMDAEDIADDDLKEILADIQESKLFFPDWYKDKGW